MLSTTCPSSLSEGQGREGRREKKKDNENIAREKEREAEARMRLYKAGSWLRSRAGGFMKRGNVKTKGEDSSG